MPCELFVGLVRSIGTRTAPLVALLKRAFGNANFGVDHIELGAGLIVVEQALHLNSPDPSTPLWKYYALRMDAGDKAREIQRGLVAALALRKVSEVRESKISTIDRGHVYIFDSLMHEAEVDVLRQAYGDSFILLSIQESEVQRRDSLRIRFEADFKGRAKSGTVPRETRQEILRAVDDLIARDDGTTRTRNTQLSMQKVFHLADFALTVSSSAEDVRAKKELASDVDRLFRCIFSDPFITPTPDEAGFAIASLAALSTTTLGRRVGASIIDSAGCVLGTGVNEVPRPGGGLYGEPRAEQLDSRDHKFVRDPNRNEDGPPAPGTGLDTNTSIKRELVEDLLATIGRELNVSEEELRAKGLESKLATDIIEYGRTVHAEMAALLMALMTGRPVANATLYCTTLPCHACARHIIGAGVGRVVYREPYPKSRLWELHPDGVRDAARFGRRERGPDQPDRRVDFEPFKGVSPGQLEKFMSWVERKYTVSDDDAEVAGVISAKLSDRLPGRISGSAVAWDLRDGPFRVREGFFPSEPAMRSLALKSIHDREEH